MDKLKPLLAYKYWFVFVAAMILPTVGWWMATGEVSAQTDAAKTAADGAFGSVPAATSPNGTYSKAVQEINAELSRKNVTFNQYLWDTQSQRRVWPSGIDKEMQKLAYGEEIPVKTRRIYRIEYFRQLRDIPKIVEAISIENPIGKVRFDLESFTPQVSPADWGTSPPDSETMWEVQEDLWLVRSLLSAVAATNAGYDNILQTPIKQIDLITLRGGSEQAGGGAPAASPEAAEGAEANPAALGAGGLGGGGLFGQKRRGGLGGGRAGTGNRQRGQISFDPAEVFGPDVAAAGGAGPDAGAEAGPADAAAAFDVFGGGQSQAKRIRYIDKEEGAPFKTRGFYMELVMDHTRLPDLMVHLASLDWPVEIVRVQQQIRNIDQVRTAQGGGAGPREAGGRLGLGGGIRRPLRGGIPDAAADGPMGRLGRGGRDEEERERAAEGARMYSAGMMKSTLVDVAIAGKMTIFQQPTEVAKPEQPATPGGDATPEQPAATDTPPAEDGDKTPGESETTEPATPATTPDTNTPGDTTPDGKTTPRSDPAEPAPKENTEPKTNTEPAEKTTPPVTESPDDEPPEDTKPKEPKADDNR